MVHLMIKGCYNIRHGGFPFIFLPILFYLFPLSTFTSRLPVLSFFSGILPDLSQQDAKLYDKIHTDPPKMLLFTHIITNNVLKL